MILSPPMFWLLRWNIFVVISLSQGCCVLFFFNDTATTEIYTLSPTRRSSDLRCMNQDASGRMWWLTFVIPALWEDRKSTRLNSSHLVISYAVFCLKKKNWAGHL